MSHIEDDAAEFMDYRVVGVVAAVFVLSSAAVWHSVGGKSDDLLTLFTFALAVSTFGLWYMAWRQSKDMKASIAIAMRSADTLVVAERAWVSVELAIQSGVHVDQEDLRLAIQIRLKNVGKSPAVNIQFETKLGCILAGNQKKWSDVACEQAYGMVAFNSKKGVSLFPGAITDYVGNFPVEREDIEKVRSLLGPHSCFSPIFVACAVAYELAFTREIHRTLITAQVRWLDPDRPGSAAPVPLMGSPIPREQLLLDHTFSAAHAD